MERPVAQLTLTEERLRTLLESAAQEGAKRALEQLGLHDDEAAVDVREMRSLLEAWRDVRRTAWHTLVQSLVKGLLTIIVLGSAAYIWKTAQ
jgi:hypothetical protein